MSQPPESPAYDAEWVTRYSSKDRLIFEFSVVVLDLDGDDFDIRDYPGEGGNAATADMRNASWRPRWLNGASSWSQ